MEKKVVKVLLISPKPPPVGGIASWTLHILKYFEHNTDQVQLLHINSALRKDKIVNRTLWDRVISGTRNLKYIFSNVLMIFKNNPPDVVHITSSASLALFKDLLLLIKSKRSGAKSIIHFRFGRIPYLQMKNNWEWKLLKKIVKLSDKCLVIDKRSYWVLRNCGLKNVYYLPNPVSPDFLSASENIEDIKKRNKGIILFVGHVKKEKGILDLANACSQLDCVHELRIMGPSDSMIRNNLTSIESIKNRKWIRLLGVSDHSTVMEEMKRCSLFVLPSYTEGFPNVIIEAMIMACPIIATEVGDIPEMLQFNCEERVGISVPIGNILVLKDTIYELLNDHNKASCLGLRARQRAIKNYTMERVINQLIKIWNN